MLIQRNSFKQSAAIVGDGSFQQSRRWFAQQAASHGMANDTWSYLFTAKVPDTEPYNGGEIPPLFPFLYSKLTICHPIRSPARIGDHLRLWECAEHLGSL